MVDTSHAQPALVLFEDARGRWGPMTDLRCVFEFRTGALTTRQRIERVLETSALGAFVPDTHRKLIAERHPQWSVNARDFNDDSMVWLVNSRWVGVEYATRIHALEPGGAVVQHDGALVAARVRLNQTPSFHEAGYQVTPEAFPGLRIERVDDRPLIDRPWHIQDALPHTLRDDLAHTTVPSDNVPTQAAHFGDHPLHISPHATVQPSSVFNTTQGPIVVDYDAVIGALCVIEGPCYVGPGSEIASHAHIRPNTVIGPMCKVGGEVNHTVIFGHSNKAHAGYLGNAIVGEWVNLGADTNVSNLKNTYGKVSMQIEEDTPAENTGRTNMGPLIGDFVRTAISTRLLTGSCVATGSMVALSGYAPKYLRRFAFLTDDAPLRGQDYDVDKFLDTAQKMMARRSLAPSDAETARLRELAGQ